MKKIILSMAVALSVQNIMMAGTVISRPNQQTNSTTTVVDQSLPPISSGLTPIIVIPQPPVIVHNDAFLVNGSMPVRFFKGIGWGLTSGFILACSAYAIELIATLATKKDCFIPHTFKGAFALTTLAAMTACISNFIGFCKGEPNTNTAMYLGGTLSSGIATGLLFTLSPTTNKSLYF